MKKNGFALAQFIFDHKNTQIPNHKPNTQRSGKPSLEYKNRTRDEKS